MGIITPIAYFVAVISDIATALILLATNRSSPMLRSTVTLALAFLSSGTLLLGAILVLPLVPTVPPVFAAPVQSGVWLFIFWHATVATGALAYIALRTHDRLASHRFFAVVASTAVGLAIAGFIVAFVFSDRLPPLSHGTSLNALVSSGVGPFVCVCLGIAALLAFRIPQPTAIDRAYALSNLLIFVELSILLIDAHRYSIIFYGGRLLVLIGATLVLIAAEQTLLASRARLNEIEWSLGRIAGESAKRAGRIRAVWEIASYVETSDHADFGTILEIAAVSLRPGKVFVGLLCHLEGPRLIIDATSSSAFEASAPVAARALYPGASFVAEGTMGHLLQGAERARGWDDFVAVSTSSTVAQELGFRSFIGAPVLMERADYFVTFTSPSSTEDEPFAEDDFAYIEVVASFFANRFKHEHHIERIRFQVEHDGLTGLVNRVQFRAAMREAIRTEERFAIALLDLDGFGRINEHDGNEAADDLLVEVAGALSGAARHDTVARMSADEFGIILHGSDSPDDLSARIERYAKLFRRSPHADDPPGEGVLPVGASIGISRFPDHGRSPEDVLRRAGIALAVAKSHGTSTTMIFDQPMESIAEQARRDVAELAAAIAHDQLAVVYQPTFDLVTREIVGAEALVRWDHPVRGRLAPSEFVEIAERNGLIEPMTRWVCARVARDMLSTPALPAGLRIYVNVSTHLLDDIPFISYLKETLQVSPRLRDHLGIEVTESAAMQDVVRSMNTLDLFRRWGLTVAIDDFGTGYSSLSYLKRLTVDMIKIDQSFVSGLPGDDRDCAITEMLLHMTARFRYATLAEGIETEEQHSWLLEHGCRFGQGYLIARPDSFATLLEKLGQPQVA